MTSQRGGIIFRLLSLIALCAVLGLVYLVRRPLLREAAGFWIVASIADLIARDLESQGVPTSAIIRFSHRANSTLEEAEGLAVLISQRHWDRVLLVTSNYHTRRARYIFRKVLPRTVSFEVAGAPSPDFKAESWWESRQGRKTFFLETVGYLDAVWELRDGQGAPGFAPAFAGAARCSRACAPRHADEFRRRGSHHMPGPQPCRRARS